MYLRNDQALAGGGGGAVALRPARGLALPDLAPLKERARELDLVVDLGARIGSRDWWRGLATCTALCAVTLALSPGLKPVTLPGATPAPLAAAQADEMRSVGIAPSAYGADTGKRMAATDAVERLAETPERPRIEVAATLGQGDGFARVLARAGVGEGEARQVADMVAGATALGTIKPGTKLDLVLGRRPNKQVARPLDQLQFRAKLELAVAVERVAGALQLKRIPIAVDDTPLRIQGRVGSSLFQSARAAGASADAVQTYLRALGQRLSVSRDVRSGDRFDIVVAHRRAATGETEVGGLLYAGLDQGRKQTRLLKWTVGGREQWFEASGVGQRREGSMRTPVVGRLTSSYGMRRHPLLGYSRFHRGVDYGAPTGTPIIAISDGRVVFSGWHGGHGNFVKLAHAGGFGSGYGHMSRIVARSGQTVRAGQIIGYVGSTGLSTGPHLHFEMYRSGASVNPGAVKFSMAPQLAGAELARFKATLARYTSLRIGGATRMAEAKKDDKKG